MDDKCVKCSYNTKKMMKAYKGRRQLKGDVYEWHRNHLKDLGIKITEETWMCNKCLVQLWRLKNEKQKNDGQPAACSHSKHGTGDGQKVPLHNVRKTKLKNSKCTLCGKLVTNSVTTVIPHNARMDLLIFSFILCSPNE